LGGSRGIYLGEMMILILSYRTRKSNNSTHYLLLSSTFFNP